MNIKEVSRSTHVFLVYACPYNQASGIKLRCHVTFKTFLYNPVIELSSAICMDMRNYKLDLHIKIVHER